VLGWLQLNRVEFKQNKKQKQNLGAPWLKRLHSDRKYESGLKSPNPHHGVHAKNFRENPP
jgi:hypothetical protein